MVKSVIGGFQKMSKNKRFRDDEWKTEKDKEKNKKKRVKPKTQKREAIDHTDDQDDLQMDDLYYE